MNKKLSLARRIMNHIAAENVVAPLTGELLIEKDAKITLSWLRPLTTPASMSSC